MTTKNCLLDYRNKYYDINKKSKLFTQKDLDIIIVQDIFKVSFKEFHSLVYVRNYNRSKAILRLMKLDKTHSYNLSKESKNYFDTALTYLSNLLLVTSKKDIDYVYMHNDSRSCMHGNPVGEFYKLNKIGLVCSPNFRCLINLQTGAFLDSFYGTHSGEVWEFLYKYNAGYNEFLQNKKNKFLNNDQQLFDFSFFEHLKNKEKIALKFNVKTRHLILTDYSDSYLNKLGYSMLHGTYETIWVFNSQTHCQVVQNKETMLLTTKKYTKLLYGNRNNYMYIPYLDFCKIPIDKKIVAMSNDTMSILNYERIKTLNLFSKNIYSFYSNKLNSHHRWILQSFKNIIEAVIDKETKLHFY